MFVITADQDGSRRTGDRVDQILAHLSDALDPGDLLLPFQRTVGDEIQAVFAAAGPCLSAALELQRHQRWAVGIGIGPGSLADEARASTGPAFVHARTAVDRASSKAVTVPVAVQADHPEPGQVMHVEALVQLLSAVVRRRSEAGWEVADRLCAGALTHREVAESLGISPQAVGQRLRVALWAEEVAVHPLAIALLDELDGS